MKQIFGKTLRKPSKEAGNSANGLPSSTISKISAKDNRKSGPSVNAITSVPHSVVTIDHRDLANGILGTSSYEALPGFRDVPNSEKHNLFLKKLKMSCVVFDFNDPTENLKEKEVKRQTLLELVEYLSSINMKITENVMQEAVKMVSVNLFRTFSPQPRESIVFKAFDLEEEEPSMDPSWSHLQIVYEFLLRLISLPDTNAKVAKKHINHLFVLKLLDLFDSEDPRERDYLKTILHCIYGKFMVHRPFIRKAINDIFYHFIFETEKKHYGISELLEILGSIINGFALPLKEEHKLFLVRSLIPLHKPTCLGTYHQQLTCCITQFIEKDSKLSDIIIRELLKYWPVTNSSKEVMFLNELEEVLEETELLEFQRCMVPLFHRIARCLTSFHFQVAERTLLLWNNDHIGSLIQQNYKVILPIIFPALENNARHHHWNQDVHGLALNVHKIFYDLDPQFSKMCLDKFEEDEYNKDDITRNREARWNLLEELAATKAVSNEVVLVP